MKHITIFILLLVTRSWIIPSLKDQEIVNCFELQGTSIIKVYVHLDELALLIMGAELTARSQKPTNPLTATMQWFGDIFDEINKEIQPYGMQLHGDFKNLSTSQMKFVYDKLKCPELNPPASRAALAEKVLLSTFKGKYGNRLIVFFCPNNPSSTLFGHIQNGKCNNILGFLYGSTNILRQKIVKELLSAIVRNKYRDDSFNKSVCTIAKQCVSLKSNIYGQYINDLKAVRHLSSEKYILPNNERLNEHDLYDDMYVDKYKTKKHMKPSKKDARRFKENRKNKNHICKNSTNIDKEIEKSIMKGDSDDQNSNMEDDEQISTNSDLNDDLDDE